MWYAENYVISVKAPKFTHAENFLPVSTPHAENKA